jgi:uncharacterized protein (TIRG00374 family)
VNDPRSGRLTDSGSRPRATRWRVLRPVVLLAFTGLSLYVLLPSLLSVFGSWRSLGHLDWPFAVLVVACVVASFVSLWELERIALGTRAWFPVITAELSSNALSHVVPSAAAGGALETSMLVDAGLDRGDTVAALTASTALQWATTAALPVLALPAVLGGARIDHRLDVAAYLGAAVLLALIALGTAAFATDKPLTLIGRAVQRLLNATVRRHDPVTDLPDQLLATRDSVRTTLGARWRQALVAAAGSTGFDYLALLCALRAVGADPRPALVLLAYVAAELLALLPFTPGGLGFVEAGLVGTLVVAGVSSSQALTATLLYRLAAYWLPLPAGAVAYLLFRRRYPQHAS